MINVFTSGTVDSMRTNFGRFKSRTITAIFVAIPLSTQHCYVKEKPGRLTSINLSHTICIYYFG